MLPQVPEPVRHPSVTRAAVGPAAVVPAAGGVAIGLAAGSDLLAVLLGLGSWLAGTAVLFARSARRRRRRASGGRAAIDPWAVPDPWRQFVRQALSAGQRFDQALREWRSGPLRERLLRLEPQVWQAVDEVWSVARQAAALTSPGGGGGPITRKQLAEELQKVQAERLRLDPSAADRAAALGAHEAAIAAQIRARKRAEDVAAETADRLRLMTAQLDEAVTELLELGVREGADVAAVGLSLDGLAQEIRALQDGLRSIETASLGPGSPDSGPPSAPTTPPAS